MEIRLDMNPKVAIVIVNWNKKDFVINLLRSLKTINYDNYEIIVVDNASTDGSQEAIRKQFPYVTLLVNKENLGGTGGFNTGMRYVLSKKKEYKYIWLLDNDVEVEKDTLIELVTVMENDESIGIAGSMILNPDDKELIVELGAFVLWRMGIWKPYLRSKKVTDLQVDMVEVDYVAACSALVRTEVISIVGLMDERFFLHWDDIDFSLRIKKAGYKVVAVSKSKVYHRVEKGFNPVIAYYDIRNGLLTISKHKKGFDRFFYMFNMIRRSIRAAIFSYFAGMKLLGNLISKGLLDFIKGNFYKINTVLFPNFLVVKKGAGLLFDNIFSSNGLKILLFPNGSFLEIKHLINTIKSKYNCYLTLMIQTDRKRLFDKLPIDNYLVFDGYYQSFLKTISILIKIFYSRYDFAISPTLAITPFSYVVKKHYLFDKKTNKFYACKETIYSFWKLILSFLIGEILSIFLIPIFYWASLKYK